MELTNECKIAFEKWFIKNHKPNQISRVQGELIFYLLPQSMQYGVMVDWFDSVGLECNVSAIASLVIEKNCTKGCYHRTNGLTRPQARIKAIKKANEIYNNK